MQNDLFRKLVEVIIQWPFASPKSAGKLRFICSSSHAAQSLFNSTNHLTAVCHEEGGAFVFEGHHDWFPPSLAAMPMFSDRNGRRQKHQLEPTFSTLCKREPYTIKSVSVLEMKQIILVTSGQAKTAEFPEGIISGIVLLWSPEMDKDYTVN